MRRRLPPADRQPNARLECECARVRHGRIDVIWLANGAVGQGHTLRSSGLETQKLIQLYSRESVHRLKAEAAARCNSL